jgi:beta-1,4-mannosyltransferase
VAQRLLTATVLVLGDLGRSPRMLHHARALAAHGWRVDLVGYAGSTLPAEVRDDPLVHVHAIADEGAPAPVRPGSRLSYLLRSAWRGMALGVRLVAVLFRVARPGVILVQNPPGLPTLPVAWAVARVRSSRLVIDWHNLTSAMLALRLGPGHPLVGAARTLERFFGRRSDRNLFVSGAMHATLHAEWNLEGIVFRDRPAASFSPPREDDRQAARARVFEGLARPLPDSNPLLVVSPTSWTADEDFGLLLDAATLLDRRLTHEASTQRPRHVVLLLTGRGPLRAEFERRMERMGLVHVTMAAAWYEPDEYPHVIAAADLGVCVHRSASGLDLPMKVMDFFGAGVPVCALDYGPCLAESVRHGDNGLVFATAGELAGQLAGFAAGVDGPISLGRLRAGARSSGDVSWESAWAEEVHPVLLRWQL